MDLKSSLEEACILAELGTRNVPEFSGPTQVSTGQRIRLEVSEPPPQNMFKLNFDGAAKGNIGSTGL